LASDGETTAPCGVPTLLSDHSPSSDTPLQPFLDQAQDSAIGYAVLNKLHRPFRGSGRQRSRGRRRRAPSSLAPLDTHCQRVQRLVRVATGTKPIREAFEVHLRNLIEDGHHGLLGDFARRHDVNVDQVFHLGIPMKVIGVPG
jgi:hypothetical protein